MMEKMDFATRASVWLHGSDTGISSEAIFHYMTLGVRGGRTPRDCSDFGRCYRLLEAFPEWKPRMHEMVKAGEDWALLIPHWDAFSNLYAEGKKDELYERLSRLFLR